MTITASDSRMSESFDRCSRPFTERNMKGEVITLHCTLIAGHEGNCKFAFTMMQAIRDQANKIGRLQTRRYG